MFKTTIISSCAAVAFLAGCGGTGTTAVVLDNTVTLNAVSDASSGFAFAATSADGGSEAGSGVYDRVASTFDASGFAGTYDATSGIVSLTGGGQATLSGLQDFSGVLLVESPDGTQLGVIGIAPTQVPTGQVLYSGVTELRIVDADAAYQLTGTMSATFDLGGSFNDLEVTLDELDGQKFDGFGEFQEDVVDVALIELNVTNVNDDGTFSTDGGASVTSGTLTGSLTGNEAIAHVGSFFGVGYDEVGAAFVVSGGQEGSLEIHGTYLGD